MYALGIPLLQFHNWIETETLGHQGLMLNGLQDVTTAKFGLRGYCLGTKLPGFLTTPQDVDPSSQVVTSLSADVCFSYKEVVEYKGWSEEKGAFVDITTQDGCARLRTGGKKIAC